MKFYESSIKALNLDINILDNQKQSDDLILIFPPGIEDARFVEKFGVGELFTSSRVVSISYPSRYKSSRLAKFDSINNLNIFLIEVVKMVVTKGKFTSIRLVGASFGTMIITSLLQDYLNEFNNFGLPITVYFVSPGEFFGGFPRKVMYLIFRPALKSLKIRKLLSYFVTDFFKVYEKENFPVNRLVDIDEQWLSTLSYKINVKIKIPFKSFMFIGKTDNVVNQQSISKLEEVFENAEIIQYEGGHISPEVFEEIKPQIVEVINLSKF